MFFYLLGCRLYDLRFDTRQSQETPAFSRTSKLPLGHSWLLIQWVPGELVPCIKRLQHEFNHSHPSRDENEWSNTDTSPHPPFARTVSTGTTPLFGKKKTLYGFASLQKYCCRHRNLHFTNFHQCAQATAVAYSKLLSILLLSFQHPEKRRQTIATNEV